MIFFAQVLKSSKNKSNDTAVQNGTNQKTSISTNGTSSNNEKTDDGGPMNKKRRILEKITYDDLEDTEQNTNTSAVQLNLSKVRKYTMYSLRNVTNFFRLKGIYTDQCQILQLNTLIPTKLLRFLEEYYKKPDNGQTDINPILW